MSFHSQTIHFTLNFNNYEYTHAKHSYCSQVTYYADIDMYASLCFASHDQHLSRNVTCTRKVGLRVTWSTSLVSARTWSMRSLILNHSSRHVCPQANASRRMINITYIRSHVVNADIDLLFASRVSTSQRLTSRDQHYQNLGQQRFCVLFDPGNIPITLYK